MSSFLVSNKTLNEIVAGIRQAHITDARHDTWITKDLSLLSASNLQGRYKYLFDKLYELNQMALKERYGEKQDFGSSYIFSIVCAPSQMQLFKHLRCLVYQCSEGDVPETLLYKDLGKLVEAIAVDIVGKMPEYEVASWD